MNINLRNDAFSKTPAPKDSWLKIKEEKKISLLENALKKMNKDINESIQIISSHNNGQVIVKLLKNLAPAERGTFLLDVEFFLKKCSNLLRKNERVTTDKMKNESCHKFQIF